MVAEAGRRSSELVASRPLLFVGIFYNFAIGLVMVIVKWLFIGFLLGGILLPFLLYRRPQLPSGTNEKSPAYAFSEAELLIDWTARRSGSEGAPEQRIFDTILGQIEAAETFLILDFFLWNPWRGAIEEDFDLRSLSGELAEALLRKRQSHREMPILVITDPINKIYGSHEPKYFNELRSAGITVVYTDLKKMPDSNRFYAPLADFWSGLIPDWKRPLLPNLLNPKGAPMTLRELGHLLHLKANHRKVLVAGLGENTRVLIGSLNPADGSAGHSNLALLVDGPVGRFAALSELAVAEWSAGEVASVATCLRKIHGLLPEAGSAASVGPRVAWRSEGQIRETLLKELSQAGVGVQVDVALFYLSDRRVIEALKDAARRGASLRILLDPNKDAFGRVKNGIPNRPVAAELMALHDAHGLTVRWADTRGEQFHAKALRVLGGGRDLLFLGSGNWTNRNIGNSNLEANLLLREAGPVGQNFDQYFEKVWANRGGLEASLPYAAWADSGLLKRTFYRFQEWSGASTF